MKDPFKQFNNRAPFSFKQKRKNWGKTSGTKVILGLCPVFPTIVLTTFLFDGNSVGFHGQNYNSDPFQGLGMPLCDKAGIISNMPLVSPNYLGGGELYSHRTIFSSTREKKAVVLCHSAWT